MFRLNIVLNCNTHDASGLFMGDISVIMIKDKLLFSRKTEFMPYPYFVNSVVSIGLFANLFTPGFIYTIII